MTNQDRETRTLSFSNMGLDRGAVEETFEPWDQTVAHWESEGLVTDFNKKLAVPVVPTEVGYIYKDRPVEFVDHYYATMVTDPILDFEKLFEIDPVARMAFRIPFLSYDEKILEDAEDYYIRFDIDGSTRKYYKNSELVKMVKPVVTDEASWEAHKAHILDAYHTYCTDENMEQKFGPYRDACARGEISIRFRLTGFFWAPRDLFDIEPHLFAYYDYPELIQEISRFQADIYKEQMDKILKIITPSVVFFEEDLSGKNGPMISPDIFDEFIAPYYREMVPFLKARGVKNIFVDTDGDFTILIPNFLDAGIEGFLPVDVNAGIDIVKVRSKHPTVKFIGGFNKLEIIDGPDAIDAEFARLLPVIRQGGYMPGVDHQAAPHTPLANYRYYIKRLREIMAEYRNENMEIVPAPAI
ncbi:MAG: uroporphyrinogen decarboxylase family protein [Eubacteriales bacterium]|nr:uroporphyrinogen decarboxylase family protein [Eubacteriales bacterium]